MRKISFTEGVSGLIGGETLCVDTPAPNLVRIKGKGRTKRERNLSLINWEVKEGVGGVHRRRTGIILQRREKEPKCVRVEGRARTGKKAKKRHSHSEGAE